jgi:hypothetical protein
MPLVTQDNSGEIEEREMKDMFCKLCRIVTREKEKLQIERMRAESEVISLCFKWTAHENGENKNWTTVRFRGNLFNWRSILTLSTVQIEESLTVPTYRREFNCANISERV